MPEEEEEGMAVWGWAVGLSLVLLAYIRSSKHFLLDG